MSWDHASQKLSNLKGNADQLIWACSHAGPKLYKVQEISYTHTHIYIYKYTYRQLYFVLFRVQCLLFLLLCFLLAAISIHWVANAGLGIAHAFHLPGPGDWHPVAVWIWLWSWNKLSNSETPGDNRNPWALLPVFLTALSDQWCSWSAGSLNHTFVFNQPLPSSPLLVTGSNCWRWTENCHTLVWLCSRFYPRLLSGSPQAPRLANSIFHKTW